MNEMISFLRKSGNYFFYKFAEIYKDTIEKLLKHWIYPWGDILNFFDFLKQYSRLNVSEFYQISSFVTFENMVFTLRIFSFYTVFNDRKSHKLGGQTKKLSEEK